MIVNELDEKESLNFMNIVGKLTGEKLINENVRKTVHHSYHVECTDGNALHRLPIRFRLWPNGTM